MKPVQFQLRQKGRARKNAWREDEGKKVACHIQDANENRLGKSLKS